jgi:hypothetical protein
VSSVGPLCAPKSRIEDHRAELINRVLGYGI